MGEIIKFSAFKREGEKEAKEKKTEENPGQEERINYDKLIELLNLVTGLISRSTGNPRGQTYQIKYDLVSSYADAEIIGWINNFDEREVAAQPFFYSALIDIARDRKLFYDK